MFCKKIDLSDLQCDKGLDKIIQNHHLEVLKEFAETEAKDIIGYATEKEDNTFDLELNEKGKGIFKRIVC